MKTRPRLVQHGRDLLAGLGFAGFVLCWLVGALYGARPRGKRRARRLQQ